MPTFILPDLILGNSHTLMCFASKNAIKLDFDSGNFVGFYIWAYFAKLRLATLEIIQTKNWKIHFFNFQDFQVWK